MSTNTLQFTAISGANSEDAVCYLLEIDEAKILLDCGSFSYTGESLDRLQRVARQVDAVLLSHADMAHVGGYPLAFRQYGMTCPAYATQAVSMMGRVCMQDVAKTMRAQEDFELFDERTVDEAFDNVTALQYSQPVSLSGRHSGIVVTAYAAGHTIGGTIWTISNGTETVLYAMDFNHMKEEHLGRSSLLEGGLGQVNRRLVRPSLLITDSYNALCRLPTRKKRLECFLESVGTGVRRGGNVLIPVDSAARVLEIAFVLNDWWGRERGRRDTHTLYLLGRCGRKMRSFAQSLTAWMGEGVGGQVDERNRDSRPFDLRHIVVVQTLEELERRMAGEHEGRRRGRGRGRARRAVVLASMEGMDMGFSQELFVRWAGERRNAIILPQRGAPNSLAHRLYTRWLERTQRREGAGGEAPGLSAPVRLGGGADFSTTLRRRVALKGAELERWLVEERRRKEQEAARAAILQRSRLMVDSDASSDEEGDSDGNGGGGAGGGGAELRGLGEQALSELELALERLRSGQSFDVYAGAPVPGSGQGGELLARGFCMFPYQEKLRRADAYGEVFDIQEFLAAATEEVDDSTNLGIDDFDNEGYSSDESASGKREDHQRPTKAVSERRRVHVSCLVGFVDLEGRADAQSVNNIIVQLMPRRVVIVHGTASSTQALATFCRDPQVPLTKEIYTPGVGETLNVSSGINAYRMRLADGLLRRAVMQPVEGQAGTVALGYIAGRVRFAAADDEVPALDADTGEGSEGALAHAWLPPVVVGDAKLSALRAVLEAKGVSARFDAEGSLVCGSVAIKRAESGAANEAQAIRLLGTPSPEYYSIRAIVYEHFAWV
ncbi:hypothetical protein GGI07_005556 [Coemansia sp. Benny D115]|nr:hypothetical protein GGI07_005556 [Coemansia sp. Benny D115]